MQFIRQFCIIIIISFFGEVLNKILHLPIPASIYGLVLMFTALKLKLFPLSKVKQTSGFLIDIMPLLFVPPGVGILTSTDIIKQYWWQFIVIAVLTTIITMGVTGVTTQWIINHKEKKDD